MSALRSCLTMVVIGNVRCDPMIRASVGSTFTARALVPSEQCVKRLSPVPLVCTYVHPPPGPNESYHKAGRLLVCGSSRHVFPVLLEAWKLVLFGSGGRDDDGPKYHRPPDLVGTRPVRPAQQPRRRTYRLSITLNPAAVPDVRRPETITEISRRGKSGELLLGPTGRAAQNRTHRWGIDG
jgi:hypothetical protein